MFNNKRQFKTLDKQTMTPKELKQQKQCKKIYKFIKIIRSHDLQPKNKNSNQRVKKAYNCHIKTLNTAATLPCHKSKAEEEASKKNAKDLKKTRTDSWTDGQP